MKWVKWVAVIFAILLIILIGITYLVEPMIVNGSDKAKEIFKEAGVKYKEHIEVINGRTNRWIESGSTDSKYTILFFHGAPGSWADFSLYLTDSLLVANSHMISIDRLGYGLSEYGQIETDIYKQVKIAHEIIQKYNIDSLIVVGYSYGGPIAPIYAVKYPHHIAEVILLAPVIHPEAEKIFWFNPIIDNGLAKAILPKYISAANNEKMHHAQSLKAVMHDWDQMTVSITHLHCEDDWIAPFEPNTTWVQSHVDSNLLTQSFWDGDSHFLPNTVPQRILPILYKVIHVD